MAAQPRLDMCHGDGGDEARQGAAERARRVTLDDEQIGPSAKLRLDCRRDGLDMRMRVLRAGAVEPRHWIAAKIEVGRIEVVLAGQD